MKKFFTTIIITLFIFSLKAQSEKPLLKINRAQSNINIDGELDEMDWSLADVASGFYQNFPTDTLAAESKTEVMMTYDEGNIYLAAICYDDLPGEHVIRSLRRDFNFGSQDNFTIYFDPFDDKINGFTFGVNPYNAQREGLVSNGSDVSLDWDNKWFSAVKKYDDRWVAEMAIPFKSIRFNKKNKDWYINFTRNDLKRNERSVWSPVPIQFQVSDLAYTGELVWDQAPAKHGPNIVIVPFSSGVVSKDFENNKSTDYDLDAGLDAKIAVSSSLNLDLTVNPDFSQVEVDEQVTDLSRFELFFPEKRQFFLENNDLFARFGFSQIRPFFSRRIGFESPIIAGARLSGKVGRDWRIGLINIQTDKAINEDEEGEVTEVAPENYTVAAIQRRVFSRSNISAIFINKQAVNSIRIDSSDILSPRDNYNRVIGVDYNLASEDNKWQGKVFYHRSFSPGINNKAYAHAAFLLFNSQHWFAAWNHELVGENYNAEVGFVPRTGYFRLEPFAEYRFYPDSKVINRHGPGLQFDLFTDLDYNVTDREWNLYYEIDFLNTSEIAASFEDNYILLSEAFNPTKKPDDTLSVDLPAGSEYRWQTISMEYESDRRKVVNYEVGGSFGGFFNGDRFSLEGEFNYRFQPYGSVSLNVNYNDIDLPDPFSDAQFWLIGPRLDITFTDKLFLTTFVQYNEQIDNVNLNARFQWRFKPVSDLFVVYTDNYIPGNLKVKNRALVIKLSYWINV